MSSTRGLMKATLVVAFNLWLAMEGGHYFIIPLIRLLHQHQGRCFP